MNMAVSGRTSLRMSILNQLKEGLKVIFCFLNPNGDEDGDDGEPGAWPDLAR